MGGGTVDDGRLDLDDLGEVIDAPTAYGAPATAEVLDDGRGRTWGDRLEDSGVGPWLRRHRVVVASAAAVVALVVVAGTAYVRLTPPPLDPELHVLITEQVPSSFVERDDISWQFDAVGIYGLGTGPYRSAYGITPTDPGDTATYAVIGLDGPAVRASAAHAQARPLDGERFASDVDVIVDCSDRASLLPAPGSFSLRIARNDAWGRTLVGSVPLQDGSVGWPVNVASTCAWQQTFGSIDLRSVAVRPGPTPLTVGLELTVANRLPQPVVLGAEWVGGAPAVDHTLAPTRVGAGETATLASVLEVNDCGSPTLNRIGFDTPGADPSVAMTPVPGAFLTVAVARDSVSEDYPAPQGGTPVVWSEATARQIDAALAAACAAAPRVDVIVLGTAAVEAVDEPLPNNGHADARVPVTVEVSTTAGTRVLVRSPEVAPQHHVDSRFAETSSPVRGGRAVLRTSWSVDCTGGSYEPPVLQAVVTTRDGDFPVQMTLTSSRLTRAMLTACPDVDRQSLADAGWDVPTS